MRMFASRLAVTIAMLLAVACSRSDHNRTDDHRQSPGEAAGHAAYAIEKGTKKAAKEVSKDLKSFAHDAREGFQDAKEKDAQRRRDRK